MIHLNIEEPKIEWWDKFLKEGDWFLDLKEIKSKLNGIPIWNKKLCDFGNENTN